MSIENLPLSSLKLLPGGNRLLVRLTADTYDSFVNVLHEDLDACFEYLEANRELRQSDSEDRLTVEIVGQLKQLLAYTVTHESKVGGHVDILVSRLGFSWFGEAKIHSSYKVLYKGFQQLCTRYLPGTANANRGGVIVYVKKGNCARVMANWRERLQARRPALVTSPCASPRSDQAFHSQHNHEGSGSAVYVRHMGVALHFSPQDRDIDSE